ncbi:DUF5009 domain-containing protein [Mucisphaera sp.]|uniref:DUF5009 domain-containing protein n=1 Tax=Mucisphaera sp. TaxID=2913024 RepID=UPI003D0A7EAC
MNEPRDRERDGERAPESYDPLSPPGQSEEPSGDSSQQEVPEETYQEEVQRELPSEYLLKDPEPLEEASTAGVAVGSEEEHAEAVPSRVEKPGLARSYAVDALRGLAILGMCLSGIVPGGLWNGMYHGYYPWFLPAELHHDAQPDAEATDVSALDAALDGPVADSAASEVWPAVSDPGTFYLGWPSFTWVDWVFPLFLFAMGVAIPLAYAARRAKGGSWWGYPFQCVWRFVVLVAFALYVHTVTPGVIDSPSTFSTWCIALVAFVIPFAVLVRLPKGTSASARLSLRLLGIAAAWSLVVWVNSRDGRSFTWQADWGGPNVDIIILLLAWSSLVTSLLWYVTRGVPWLRLLVGLPFAFVAHHVSMREEWRLFSSDVEGGLGQRIEALTAPVISNAWLDLRWVNDYLPGSLPESVLDMSPLYAFGYFKFVWIVVAGTVIGDVIVSRGRKAALEPERTIAGWGWGRVLLLSLLYFVTVVGVFVGLKDYATTFADLGFVTISTPYAALLVLVPLAGILALVQSASDLWDRHVRVLTWWGSVWLVAGLVLAVLPGPAGETTFAFFEGGIKKGPPSTLSWYCVSLGLGILTVAWWTMWLDARGVRWPAGLLIANGQNPMLAYVGIRNLLAPLVALPILLPFVADPFHASPNILMRSWLAEGGPWMLFLWSVGQTFLLALAVCFFTRAKLVWRS